MKEDESTSLPGQFPVEPPEDIEDYDHPQAKVNVEYMDYLIGKVFTHTELLGLTDRQLSAYKSTLRQMFWGWYNQALPNPHGLADVSLQARRRAGIEKDNQ